MSRFRRRFWNWQTWVALAILALFAATALLAPLISPAPDPANPTAFKLIEGRTSPNPLPPGPDAPLGTAVFFVPGLESRTLHYDILHSLLWGTRSVLRFGLLSAIFMNLVGVVIGAVSGYAGGIAGKFFMRIADAFLAFPLLAGVWLFRIVLNAVHAQIINPYTFGQLTLTIPPFLRLLDSLMPDPLMLTLILFAWVPSARVINASVARLKSAEYVLAARSVGVSRPRLIVRHLLPNAIAPAIVLVARDVGNVVILQAAFAYIGVLGGLDSTTIPEWDRLLIIGRNWIIGLGGNPFRFWWLYLPVTVALVLFGVAWNMLGDSLNTALNPRETGVGVAEEPVVRRRWWGGRKNRRISESMIER